MPNPTPTEWRILQFAKDHPEMSQRQIAIAVDCHPTCVSRAYRLYMPERRKKYEPGVPTELQARIIEARKKNPKWLQVQIAKYVGCDKSIVSQTIRKYLPEYAVQRKYISHKKKPPEIFTMRTCLKCDRQFKSSWIGNKICPDCLGSMEYQYIPDHSVYVEGNGRV